MLNVVGKLFHLQLENDLYHKSPTPFQRQALDLLGVEKLVEMMSKYQTPC